MDGSNVANTTNGTMARACRHAKPVRPARVDDPQETPVIVHAMTTAARFTNRHSPDYAAAPPASGAARWASRHKTPDADKPSPRRLLCIASPRCSHRVANECTDIFFHHQARAPSAVAHADRRRLSIHNNAFKRKSMLRETRKRIAQNDDIDMTARIRSGCFSKPRRLMAEWIGIDRYGHTRTIGTQIQKPSQWRAFISTTDGLPATATTDY
jgi:hypothetical protein